MRLIIKQEIEKYFNYFEYNWDWDDLCTLNITYNYIYWNIKYNTKIYKNSYDDRIFPRIYLICG